LVAANVSPQRTETMPEDPPEADDGILRGVDSDYSL
jgi:hypothetical protein